jgi:glycerol-3-phosphate dehydrogenase (NAD(P)+)
MNIAILGAGAWGTALAMVLNENGHQVRVWGNDPERLKVVQDTRRNEPALIGVEIPAAITFVGDFSAAVQGAEVLLFATPSKFLRETATRIAAFNGVVITASKGIEFETGFTMGHILQQEIPGAQVAVVSGPSFAPEVARHVPTAVVVASENAETTGKVQLLFHRPHFRVYTNRDMLGVELGGALKNVIAIAAGVCDGLGFGDNTKAAVVTRGIAEMRRLGVACGARAETFAGLSGLGDLMATCFSKLSRNRGLGEHVGKGERLSEVLSTGSGVAEGYPTARSALKLAEKFGIDAPIISETHAILYEGKAPAAALRDLTGRDSTSED